MLSIGIIGLPNVGKSTLFKALTRQNVEIANYPFATIAPHVGIVEVPDERLWRLSELSNSKKTVPAIVQFVDIAGLVKGAAEGAGLGNKFLAHIKEVNAIAEVVRIFEDKDIIHVSGKPDPVSDIDVIEYELILKDLETITKRIESIQKEVKGGRPGVKEAAAVLDKIKKTLEDGGMIIKNEAITKDEHFKEISGELQLLTGKKMIYVFNASEIQIQENWQSTQGEARHQEWRPPAEIRTRIGNAPYAVISAKIEAELAELNIEERKEFLNSVGIKESGLDQLIRIGYRALDLITFFTTGDDETRAWTIPANSSAPRAGRAIHSDFEQKFIRAEVVTYDDLIKSGSLKNARDLGLLRTEGREYTVKDGDIIEFKI